jgi:hypothetical protein
MVKLRAPSENTAKWMRMANLFRGLMNKWAVLENAASVKNRVTLSLHAPGSNSLDKCQRTRACAESTERH